MSVNEPPASSWFEQPGERAGAGDDVRVTLRRYDGDEFEERDVAPSELDTLAGELRSGQVLWIDAAGPGCAGLALRWGQVFGVPPRLVGDVADPVRRPALSTESDEHLGITFKLLSLVDTRVRSVHAAVIVGRGYVLSLSFDHGDPFGPVCTRVTGERGRLRREGSDRLAHALLEQCVDGYFALLEGLETRIEKLESTVEAGKAPPTLGGLHRARSQLVRLRRAVWPLRDGVGALLRTESPLIGDGARACFGDLHGHVLHVIETSETLRDLVSSVRDLYLTKLDSRLNETMRVLTVIATVFMPLSFLAGVYGMNFENMPELKQAWAYPALLGVMAIVAVAMLLFFRRKRWI